MRQLRGMYVGNRLKLPPVVAPYLNPGRYNSWRLRVARAWRVCGGARRGEGWFWLVCLQLSCGRLGSL
jgi:hypothetical protein